MSQAIKPSFHVFSDIDGQPLENGYIYVGTAGLAAATNQIQVYWDSALTIPATQPIRTTAGYPMRSGSPSLFFIAADDYSLQVSDKNNSSIYSALNKKEVETSASITFKSSGSGAVTRTVQDKLSEFWVSVKDFGAIGDGVTDDTAAIQAAFGGDGTTPDNTHVYFPNGVYKTTSSIKVYRSGETLTNVSITGESPLGVTLKNDDGPEVPGDRKGIVIGEPAATDALWGAAVAINTVNVSIKNFGTSCNDIGLWCVYCRDVTVENVHGDNLVVFVAGNDAADDCENVMLNNVRRVGEGATLIGDAWYSIGLYRVTRFVIDGYVSEYLSAGFGTGGSHIIVSDSINGTITNCIIDQSQVSGTGIKLEQGSENIVVDGNSITGCSIGIVSFALTNTRNVISNNVIRGCDYGIDVQSNNNVYANNYIDGSATKDFIATNVNAQPNYLIGNKATSWDFDPAIEGLNSFMGNIGAPQKIFIPAINFKQYNPTAATEYDISTLELLNTGGSIRAAAVLDAGGRTGVIKDVTFHFDRLVPVTSIGLYVFVAPSSAAPTQVGTTADSTNGTGVMTATVTYTASITNERNFLAVYIPTAASISKLIGVSFTFTENGLNSFVST